MHLKSLLNKLQVKKLANNNILAYSKPDRNPNNIFYYKSRFSYILSPHILVDTEGKTLHLDDVALIEEEEFPNFVYTFEVSLSRSQKYK